MPVVGERIMSEIQVLVLIVFGMSVQALTEKLDNTGGVNIMKPNNENGLIEQYSNVRHIHNPEEYNTNPKKFREEDTNEIMHKFDKLENI